MSSFISQNILRYLARPITYDEKLWLADNRRHKRSLPKITSGPKKANVIIKESALVKPNLNKPEFLTDHITAALIRANRCPDCAKEIHIEHFKTEIHKKEYGISGKCVECQASPS